MGSAYPADPVIGFGRVRMILDNSLIDLSGLIPFSGCEKIVSEL
jgi:hypothetical protein